MKKILDERLIYEILSVVEEIPLGKVATYGQIARLIGREKNARLVGRVLGMAEYYGSYPICQVSTHFFILNLVLGFVSRLIPIPQTGIDCVTLPSSFLG